MSKPDEFTGEILKWEMSKVRTTEIKFNSKELFDSVHKYKPNFQYQMKRMCEVSDDINTLNMYLMEWNPGFEFLEMPLFEEEEGEYRKFYGLKWAKENHWT